MAHPQVHKRLAVASTIAAVCFICRFTLQGPGVSPDNWTYIGVDSLQGVALFTEVASRYYHASAPKPAEKNSAIRPFALRNRRVILAPAQAEDSKPKREGRTT